MDLISESGGSAPAAAAGSGSQAVAAKSGDLGLDILDDEDWVPARREGLCELCIACGLASESSAVQCGHLVCSTLRTFSSLNIFPVQAPCSYI